jgi:hypothetical protein
MSPLAGRSRFGLFVAFSILLLLFLSIFQVASFVRRDAVPALHNDAGNWEKLALKKARSARGGDLYLLGVGKADITG